MTRVRVKVVDNRRVDIDAIKRVAGVKGYMMQGRQHQLTTGPGAAAKIVVAMRRPSVAPYDNWPMCLFLSPWRLSSPVLSRD